MGTQMTFQSSLTPAYLFTYVTDERLLESLIIHSHVFDIKPTNFIAQQTKFSCSYVRKTDFHAILNIYRSDSESNVDLVIMLTQDKKGECSYYFRFNHPANICYGEVPLETAREPEEAQRRILSQVNGFETCGA